MSYFSSAVSGQVITNYQPKIQRDEVVSLLMVASFGLI